MRPKVIHWTAHGEARSIQRGITRDDVELTLTSPDYIQKMPEIKGANGGFKRKYRKTLPDGRIVWAVAEVHKDDFWVITTYCE